MNPVHFVLALVSAWPFLVLAQSAASIAYTPTVGQCPHRFHLIRKAGSPPYQTLSPSELEYLQARKSKVLPNAWKTYLANVQNSQASRLPSYVSNILNGHSKYIPNLGIATSGGGYRAALFGAGVLNSLDGRNSSSVKKGTGGLLQAASYISGLSGGSWLVTSLYEANFPNMQELIFGSEAKGLSGWMTGFGIIAPTNNSIQTQGFIAELVSEIRGKHDAGFPVTFGDVWARTLARHFLAGTTKTNFFDNSSHGAGKTFSGMADL
jgi:lysophospholipase